MFTSLTPIHFIYYTDEDDVIILCQFGPEFGFRITSKKKRGVRTFVDTPMLGTPSKDFTHQEHNL